MNEEGLGHIAKKISQFSKIHYTLGNCLYVRDIMEFESNIHTYSTIILPLIDLFTTSFPADGPAAVINDR